MQNHIFKTVIALFVLSVFNFTETYAQGVPQGFNYQAIARDASNLLVANHAIGIKIGIYSGSASGTLEWEETHTPSSNQFGLFTLVIGQGTSTGNGSISTFSSINWGAASHYLKVSMDITGGSNYVQMDNSQLLSVPYAFYSAQASSVPNLALNDLVDADTAGSVTIADTDDNKIVFFEVHKPKKRYFRVVTSRATANATVDYLDAKLWNATQVPVTQDATTVEGGIFLNGGGT